ncbi:MAG: 3-methyl-2-oxobutanoate dehydrogenase subunit VorB [Dethiobacteria bacterium]|nr:3-methyl-2-oxobutanoate dehydrogenase subunit VorB [Bacillota bacterium]
MTEKKLLKGNVALAQGAIDAGCRFYFGYPITPQNDIPEYLSAALPAAGGVFVQAESELASINMVLGAAAAGGMAMTSSSGPGISLMQEGLSYLAGSELPALIVNITRSGPGLGGIAPTQGDYLQATKGGGHGDYRLIVLAPNSAQEMYDLAGEAFRLAFKYRNPAMILGDAILGQMKEPVSLKKTVQPDHEAPWALTGAKGRPPQLVKSLFLKDGEMTEHNWKLYEKYKQLKKNEVKVEIDCPPGCELVIAAFGSCSRIVRSAVDRARKRGLRIGFIRPITLFPFPENEIRAAAAAAGKVLVVEMNTGQMIDDVRLACDGNSHISFKGYPGGIVPTPEDIGTEIDLVLNRKEVKICQL